jgi:hypothetical protein
MRLLPLITSMSQIYTPDPNAPPEEYRRAVAASIQDLVAGRRPRDPALSGASTGRLILEGVVESVKVYRLYQQEKMSKVSEVRRWGGESGIVGERVMASGITDPTDMDNALPQTTQVAMKIDSVAGTHRQKNKPATASTTTTSKSMTSEVTTPQKIIWRPIQLTT